MAAAVKICDVTDSKAKFGDLFCSQEMLLHWWKKKKNNSQVKTHYCETFGYAIRSPTMV